ncbi:hypothetical protein [uncultured Victivallis sp.]|uniref:hypothetical protein n=1 Tax=uncultured Victivallis sp. TaxID=354118 RepID=UPI00259491D3|nr:hypothetical protein [uncultured Victivallis sp.]
METRTFKYQGKRFRVYIGDCAELFLNAGDLEKIVSIKRKSLEQDSEYFEEWKNNVCKTIRTIPEKTFVSLNYTLSSNAVDRYLPFLEFFYSEVAPKIRISFGYSYNQALCADVDQLTERLQKAKEEYLTLLDAFVELAAKFGTLCRETGRTVNKELSK